MLNFMIIYPMQIKNKGKSASVIALRALAEQEMAKEEAFLTFTFGSDYSLSF